MTDMQYYTIVAVPLVGILMNAGLFIYLGGRMDRLIDKFNDLDKRVAILEERTTLGRP